ncbi:MAG: hypothetical protein ACOYOV_14400 [Bacteroidales bacterium]
MKIKIYRFFLGLKKSIYSKWKSVPYLYKFYCICTFGKTIDLVDKCLPPNAMQFKQPKKFIKPHILNLNELSIGFTSTVNVLQSAPSNIIKNFIDFGFSLIQLSIAFVFENPSRFVQQILIVESKEIQKSPFNFSNFFVNTPFSTLFVWQLNIKYSIPTKSDPILLPSIIRLTAKELWLHDLPD